LLQTAEQRTVKVHIATKIVRLRAATKGLLPNVDYRVIRRMDDLRAITGDWWTTEAGYGVDVRGSNMIDQTPLQSFTIDIPMVDFLYRKSVVRSLIAERLHTLVRGGEFLDGEM
jgi:hypothetical protein